MHSEEEITAFNAAADILERVGRMQLARELRGGCLRVYADEPIFVLRGQDPTAQSTVADWVRKNEQSASEAKLWGAAGVVAEMAAYPRRKSAAD